MTAWLARAGFLTMWAGAGCLLVEAVVAVTTQAGLVVIGWAVATFTLTMAGAAAVLVAAERRRRGL